MADDRVRRFMGSAKLRPGGGAFIPLPFDPAAAWGRRERYHVNGTIEGVRFRGPLVAVAGAWNIELGLKSPSAAGLREGQAVTVEIAPEGPQLDQLADDVTAALHASPKALAAFESLATFYRKGWLRWIDATKRRPELRAARIAEMVRLVAAGHKERPEK